MTETVYVVLVNCGYVSGMVVDSVHANLRSVYEYLEWQCLKIGMDYNGEEKFYKFTIRNLKRAIDADDTGAGLANGKTYLHEYTVLKERLHKAEENANE